MLFLTLSPFAAFAFLMTAATTQISVIVAAGLSLALLIADRLRGRSLKALQLAAAIAFTGVALYVSLVDRRFSANLARAAIDVTMLAVGLGSLLFRAPFTLQYARETVTSEIAERPEFRRVNILLTAIWTAAVAMLAADLCAIFMPWLPLWTGVAAAFAARNGAAYFTQWYTAKRRAKVAAERALAAPGVANGSIA